MRRLLASALSTTALAATATLATSGTAAADPDWDELAQCESGGNWSINTGNGYQGGLQFSDSTWDAYGGEQYASSANHASRAEQIAVARRVLAAQGYGAWPGCSASTGWEDEGTSNVGQPTRKSPQSQNHQANRSTEAVRQAPAQVSEHQVITVPRQAVPTLGRHAAVPPGGKVWQVVRGDTLTSIAARNGLDYQALYELNRDVVEHPDWIFPGERLVIPSPTR